MTLERCKEIIVAFQSLNRRKFVGKKHSGFSMSWNRIVTFLLIPVFFLSQFELPAITIKAVTVSNEFDFWQEPSHTGNFYTFDDVLALLEEIENGDLEHLDLATLNRIAYMIAVLAQNGLLPNEDADELN